VTIFDQNSLPPDLPRLDRQDGLRLAMLLGLFLASRILWVETNLAAAVYWEEDFRWVVLHEILGGPLRSILDYQADHYQGGSLLLTLLAAGFTWLFGVSALSYKMAAISCSTGTLALLYIVGRKAFGQRTALLVSLGYIAGPPLIAYWGLVVMGSHGESLLFSLGMLLLFHRLLTTAGRTMGTWFGFGLVAGLGLWFCPTAGVTLGACGLTWLVLMGLPRIGEFCAATGGAALGLVPWLGYNLQYGFPGLDRILEMFGYLEPIDPWIEMSAREKAWNLVSNDWLEGIITPWLEPLPGALAGLLQLGYGLPFALGLILFAARLVRGGGSTRQRELVYAIYGVAFLGVFLGTSFAIAFKEGPVSYRFFLPGAVILSLPVAESAARAFAARRAIAVACIALLLFSSGGATVFGATRDMSRKRPLSNDFGYQVWGLLSHRKYERTLDRALAETRVIPELLPRLIMVRGVAWGVAFRFEQDGKLEPIENALALARGDEVRAVLGGYEWTAEHRLRGVAEQVIAGEAPPQHLDTLARNRWLLEFVVRERKERGIAPPPRNWKPPKTLAPNAS
jgi:hypothetical protein